MLTDRRGNIIGEECNIKWDRKEIRIQKYKCGNSANVEYEMLCYNGNHWAHGNCNWGTIIIFGKKYHESIQ